MFDKGEEIINKITGERAIVLHIDDEDLMTVRFRRQRFAKGNLEGFGVQVLIKNFEKYFL